MAKISTPSGTDSSSGRGMSCAAASSSSPETPGVDARQLAHAAHEQQGSQHDPGIYGYGQIEDHRQREGQDHHRPVGLRPLENMPHRPQIAHVIGDHDQHGGEGRQRDVFGQRAEAT